MKRPQVLRPFLMGEALEIKQMPDYQAMPLARFTVRMYYGL